MAKTSSGLFYAPSCVMDGPGCIYWKKGKGGTEMRRGGCPILGICALALGLGIFAAAIFPTGCLLFIVAFLLIACGWMCVRR